MLDLFVKGQLPAAYETMATVASPAINFGRGILGYQDPFITQTMQDRMKELESQKGTSGTIGYEDYGLPVTKAGGRFTGGLFNLAINNPVDFGLAGSVGRYGFGPEGYKGLKYDFTPDKDTGSTGNKLLDFINEGGIKSKLSNYGKSFASLFDNKAMASEPVVNFTGIKNLATDFDFNTARALENREALNKQGLLSLDDAGLTAPDYEEFTEVAKPGFNKQFAKQLGITALGLLTGNPFVGLIARGLGALADRGGLTGIRGGVDLRGDTGFDTFRRSTSLADFFQRRRDKKAREDAAKRGAEKQKIKDLKNFHTNYKGFFSGQNDGGNQGSGNQGASPGSQGPGGSDEMGSF